MANRKIIECTKCSGTGVGFSPGYSEPPDPCQHCQSAGKVYENTLLPAFHDDVECPDCDGTGKESKPSYRGPPSLCLTCNGQGVVEMHETDCRDLAS